MCMCVCVCARARARTRKREVSNEYPVCMRTRECVRAHSHVRVWSWAHLTLPYKYVCARASTPTRTHAVGCMGCPGRATVRTRIECAAIQRVILSMCGAVHRATRKAKGGLLFRLRHANKTTLVSCWLGSVRYPWNTHRRLEIGTGTHARNVERLMQHQWPGASMRPGCPASSVKRDEPPSGVRALCIRPESSRPITLYKKLLKAVRAGNAVKQYFCLLRESEGRRITKIATAATVEPGKQGHIFELAYRELL